MWNLKARLIGQFTAGAMMTALSLTTPAEAAGSPIGMNLSYALDWAGGPVFVDIFKLSRPWTGYPKWEKIETYKPEPLALTPDGWIAKLEPEHTAVTYMLGDKSAQYPAGIYTLLYDGEAKDANGRVINPFRFGSGVKVVRWQPGRLQLDVTPLPGGITLIQYATNPDNPVRNIHFLMPGTEATYQTQPYYPKFIERLEPFRVIRFINWLRIDWSPLAHWSDRTRPDAPTQSSPNGVAIETAIDLANKTRKDAWFNVPHMADDEYVRNMAQLVRDKLSPDLKVYVEYSNEVWNSTYFYGANAQAKYAREQGMAMKLSETNDPYQAQLRFYALRAKQVLAIWKEVFGEESSRLTRVIAAQSGNDWVARTELSFQKAAEGADVLAIAPYFNDAWLSNPTNAAQIAKMRVDEVIAKLENTIDVTIRGQISANKSVADNFKLPLIAYEGGQHLISNNMPTDCGQTPEPGYETCRSQITRLYTNVNRDPEMGRLYTKYLNLWNSLSGGTLFNALTYTLYPTEVGAFFGVLEYADQPLTSPDQTQVPHKYNALASFIKSH